jgi:hypothetical protein
VIRALVACAAACALAACGVIGPAQPDVERALHAYYTNGTPEGAPDLHEATLAEFEGCVPRNGFFKCPMVFQTPVGRLPTVVTLERDAAGWRIQHIALNTPSH